MQPCKKHAGKAFQDSTRACTWAHTHSARRHVNKLFETHLHYFLVHAATPSFSPLRLSSASWPTTSLSAKCQRATSALSPKPSSASTFGAIGQANMACRAHCMCLRAQLVSLGPAVHQVTLQDGSKGLPSLGLRLSGLVLETRTGLHGLQSLTKGGGLFLPCQN